MRISDIKGEHALDVLADMLEPFTEILSDEKVKATVVNGDQMGAIKEVLKNHKKAIITIMALIDGKNPETYQPTLPEIPIKILQILNDPVFAPFFPSQGQNQGKTSSGSATVNIVETEHE